MWRIETFDSLSKEELYTILKNRVNIFVVEQKCPYPELDDHDQDARHIFFEENNDIICYARILPAGTKYEYTSIGRVIVVKKYRQQGWAKKLMEKCLEVCGQDHSNVSIQLQAQAHLQHFYGAFGFTPISDVYDEDGIPHVDMVRK
ncbi:GNAT family N-acetyltransferase [Paenisporosarcina cavernae]|uniref:GNAT family N-acetyltransferase n=1 Tax=Paenisporosarcina cavernae TaxID=2320858 RepID=A0A385YUM3_9BACL|nr:GNAT family N-acetyltransferase [Paenisporosarcina cavernae]AYC30386.1 GNAT family N-acetyltransferase [Paenisporosarcina cavernae]